MNACECLVLGPEGAGKTLLLKRLLALCSEERLEGKRKVPASSEGGQAQGGGVVSTIPTVGTNVQELALGKRLGCTVREYGGSMAPLWITAYEHCHMVIYIMDTSRPTQISASTVLLMEVLSAEALRGKPILLLLNKTDSPFAMSAVELKSIMRLDDVVKALMPQNQVTVLQVSCASGEGLEEVLQWIRETTTDRQ